MAKKCSVLRNEKRIKMAARQRELRAKLRKDRVNMKLSEEDRAQAQLKLQSLPRNGAPSRIRNRCQFTGRSRGVYKKFMLSRIMFREMAHKGLIPGVTKASW